MLLHSAAHLSIGESLWRSFIGRFPGVPIFFVISGFLISATYERNINVKTYIQNRILRIYPALWSCIFITIPIAIYFDTSFFNPYSIPWLISQLIGIIYTPEFLKNFGFGSYNGSLWTIPVELQFYSSIPIIYWLMQKTRNPSSLLCIIWVLFIVIAFCIAFIFPSIGMGSGYETKAAKLLRYSFIPHFYLFLTGVLLQYFSIHKSRYIVGKGGYWISSYIVFTYSITWLTQNPLITNIINNLFLGIAILSSAYTYPNIISKVINKMDISYGVYIYHGLLINIFISMNFTNSIIYLLLLCSFTYLIGYASWRIVERPFLRKKKQALRPMTPSIIGETGKFILIH